MKKITINGTEYKIKFGYNSFCDTDLMDRTSNMITILANGRARNDNDILGMGIIKELFIVVRELLFVGFKKYNPVESVETVGDMLDDYKDEPAPEGEDRSLLGIFAMLSAELNDEGFFGELIAKITQTLSENQTNSKKKK